MKIVVLSGKGGTGKTTIAIALSELIGNTIKIDCDVDAANMHLYYNGEIIEQRQYMGNKISFVDKDLCTECGKCTDYCKFDSINSGKVNSLTCEGCGVCKIVCPNDAIELKEIRNADTFIIKTNNGIISKADMDIGAEGSGKLINEIKQMAKKYTSENDITIIDGSPGIGCPVIASITGSDIALLVIEPSKSGLSDFFRIKELCDHFSMPVLVCINKYDMNKEISKQIEEYCKEGDINIVGRISFDDMVLESINSFRPIVYYPDSKANKEIRFMWETIKNKLNLEG
ncbi:cobyrinic acid a,c-diamide synthase [Gottschalkia acidurici 9a]|uniref:Cobyrinic acid a,c-diamide synthase n=1 Tax=Gottschalkia acidurici (strain ATCC 7906 / DSM 604 / BCRC 14475 / CIP 104303 / KCTC 5404 / NCIMB 10678 / 9a) TaxID=1128398 RepID=K0AXM4_GOTA9|nr:ATP-binding protein [Gottschalkia acidurici]AFS77490.1 cobyrinic acid a,c-diamide synthase [Gottschalkia acidurici 9a]